MHEQHTTLWYEYKNATSLEKTHAHYATIWCQWYSLGAMDAAMFQDMEN
jgi:hypothetical protein